jgi:hypothetical protein
LEFAFFGALTSVGALFYFDIKTKEIADMKLDPNTIIKDVVNTKQDYNKFYNLYRKLPLINFIGIVSASLLFGILDATIGITPMYWDLDAVVVLIWPIIGVLVGGISYFFTMLSISPTIIRTDAIIEILEIAKQNNTKS